MFKRLGKEIHLQHCKWNRGTTGRRLATASRGTSDHAESGPSMRDRARHVRRNVAARLDEKMPTLESFRDPMLLPTECRLFTIRRPIRHNADLCHAAPGFATCTPRSCVRSSNNLLIADWTRRARTGLVPRPVRRSGRTVRVISEHVIEGAQLCRLGRRAGSADSRRGRLGAICVPQARPVSDELDSRADRDFLI